MWLLCYHGDLNIADIERSLIVIGNSFLSGHTL